MSATGMPRARREVTRLRSCDGEGLEVLSLEVEGEEEVT